MDVLDGEMELPEISAEKARTDLQKSFQPFMGSILEWFDDPVDVPDADIKGQAVRSAMEVKKELAMSSSTWTKCVLSDMKELKIKSVKELEDKSKNRSNFRKISSAYIQK